MFTIRRLGHVGLKVRDLEAMIDFYTTVLGLKLTERIDRRSTPGVMGVTIDHIAFLRCNSDHHCMALFQVAPDARKTAPEDAGFHHLAFELGTFEEVAEVYRKVKAHGARELIAQHLGAGLNLRIYFLDPEDNQVEIYWNLDQIGWDGQARPYPIMEDIDLENYDPAEFLALKARTDGLTTRI